MYCTVDDLRKSQQTIRLVEATDDAQPNQSGAIQASIAEEMIMLACGLMNGYIGGRVSLPLVQVPEIIRKIAIDLSLFNLYERVGKTAKDSPIDRRREQAIALLRDIQKGNLSLDAPAVGGGSVAPSSGGALILTGAAEFSMDSMSSLGGTFR